MNLPRQALALSIVYTIPLLIWLVAGLEFTEWNEDSLRFIFRQALAALLLLQLLSTALLCMNSDTAGWQDNALGILQLILFPLPLLVLIWLTGSASPGLILKSLLLACSLGLIAVLVQQLGRPGLGGPNYFETGRALAQVLLAIMVWNFRELWWGWLEL